MTKFIFTIHKFYMELKAEPVVGENLLGDRMHFWERMVWQQQERKIELEQLYNRTINFLTENNVSINYH